MRPRQSSLGIGEGPVVDAGRGRGFNEAEAIKPRNLRVLTIEQRRVEGASMRPRQSSLGIVLSPRHGPQALRTGFNEAEAIKPRNPSAQVRSSNHAEIPASMRPRQSSLGIRHAMREKPN